MLGHAKTPVFVTTKFYIMENKVTKAEQRLNNYAKRTGMSEEGKHWLMAAIDPFHDKPLSINGYPDGTPGKSIVQCIKLAADIAKPGALASGATWDCMISSSNFLNPHLMDLCSQPAHANTVQLPAPLTSFSRKVGGLTITKAASGAVLAYDNSGVPTLETTNLSVPANVYEGKSRVLAMGFEVQNTSNALYKNGSVTVFELPCDISEDKFTMNLQNGAYYGCTSVLEVPPLPDSISKATAIPGAKSWEAKDGCYLTCRQAGTLNPPKGPQHVASYQPSQNSAYTFPLNTPNAYLGQWVSPPEAPVAATQLSYSIPYHCKGAYFTNLSEQTTLKVCYNVWIERFPNTDQFDLMTLATESCDYDPQSIEAWAHISSQMPVGVTFEENGLGDWFTGEVASLIDSLTGTKFASGIDRWQKEKFNGVTQDPAQIVHKPQTTDKVVVKRIKMNNKAAKKGKTPKQGPITANGSFKTKKKV